MFSELNVSINKKKSIRWGHSDNVRSAAVGFNAVDFYGVGYCGLCFRLELFITL